MRLGARLAAVGLALLSAMAAPGARANDAIKIGVLKATASGPAFIAGTRGYFTAQGLDAQLVFFDSAQPVSVATASGDVDFGYTGLTGGFYGLAAQGTLRIIGGGGHETKGFAYEPVLISNKAWDAGFRTFQQFPGHTYAVSQIGAPTHYALGLVAQKYGFDIKSMHILPLQSIPNSISALVGGQADAGMVPGNMGPPLVAKGDVHLLAFIGNETPFQLAVLFASAKTADGKVDIVKRTIAAIAKGSKDYHDAFISADGKRQDGPTATETIALIAKYTGQQTQAVAAGISYIDAEQRLDVPDVERQVAWYKEQGLVKGPLDGAAMIDNRYVVPLPAGL